MESSGSGSASDESSRPLRLRSARFRFLARSGLLLLRYPGTLFDLRHGFGAGARAMERRVSAEFEHSPRFVARVGGARIHLHPENTLAQNASMAIAGWYEPPVAELFSALCRRGGWVVDVGANIGWYTFLAAQRVGGNGLVLAYEPEPENFRLLSQSLRENPRPQIRVLPSAVSDHDGEETLFLSDEAASFHSTTRTVGPRSISVRSERLDSIVAAHPGRSVSLLKVDVEGGEPRVLRGALGTIREGAIPHVLIEWRPESWAGESSLWGEITSRYQVYRIVASPRLLVKMTDVTVDAISDATTRAGTHGKDLYLERRD